MMTFVRAPYSKSLQVRRELSRQLSPRRQREQRRHARHHRITSCALRHNFSTTSSASNGGFYSHGADGGALKKMALISDVHVFDRVGIWNEDVTQFIGQRALGLLNIVTLRGPSTYDHRVLELALADMKSEGVEHLIVAGDVSNLSINCEFALAAEIFRTHGGPVSSMTFCPGNHDTYNRGQADAGLFREHFADYIVSDLPSPDMRKDGFPFAHVRGGVLFVVLNTGLPNTARGAVGKIQWDAARSMLETPEGRQARKKARYTVLVMHHAAQDPAVRGTPWIREFKHDTKDWPAVAEFAEEFDINLVVHGHMHVPYRGVLAGTSNTHVYESGSGTLITDNKDRVARYTVFELDDTEKASASLASSYARVWDKENDCFQTLPLSVPPLGQKQRPDEVGAEQAGTVVGATTTD